MHRQRGNAYSLHGSSGECNQSIVGLYAICVCFVWRALWRNRCLEAAKKNQVQGQPSIDEYSAFWYRLGALLLLLAAFFQATAQLDGMNDHEWIFVPVLLAIWISMFALVWLVGLRTDWEVYDGWKGAIIVPTFAAILALTVTFAVAVPFFG